MIVFRTECGATQGWGHMMRCLAVADAARAHGGNARFVVTGDLARARALTASRFVVEQARKGWESTLPVPSNRGVVVLDGYSLGAEEAKRIVRAGWTLAVMSDDGREPIAQARLIVNGNLFYARPEVYTAASHATLLLGPRFTPLRPELHTHRREESVRARAGRIMVLPGGSDAGELIAPVLDILLNETPTDTTVLLAGTARDVDARGHRLDWVREPQEVAAAMGASDIAIAAGGMSSYELAYLGIPSILVPASAMQRPVSAELQRLGVAHLVQHEALRSQLPALLDALAGAAPRQAMRDAGLCLFDGRGAARIASALLGLEKQNT